jgi:hypothetical protein
MSPEPPSQAVDAAPSTPAVTDAAAAPPMARDAAPTVAEASAPPRDTAVPRLPDAARAAANPAFAGLAAESALDLGRFDCTPVPGEGASDCQKATDYSGFVYDPHRHQMVLFGGGHATTMTDTVKVLDLAGALKWTDLYAPTPCSAMLPDNVARPNGAWVMGAMGPYPRPVVSHTYDLLAVPPRLDELVVIGRMFNGGTCSKAGNDIGGRIAHYDRAAGTWTFSSEAGASNDLNINIPASEPDPVSGQIVVLGSGGLRLYDPAMRTFTYNGSVKDPAGKAFTPSGTAYANHMAYFPPDDRFYWFQRGRPVEVYALTLDRANPSKSMVEKLATSGPTSSNAEPGYDYDASNKVIGGGVNDGNFYTFDPATRTWTAHPMNGGKPGNIAYHSIAYDPIDNVFVFITQDRHTWAYRLGNGKRP